VTHPRIICLGEILFDRLANQRGKPIEEVESWTDYPGGAPANVACGVQKLGTPSAFVGCVGRDDTGNELVSLLEELGVDTTGVQRHPTAPTRRVYVVRSPEGEPDFAGFGDTPTTEFADAKLQAEALPEMLFQQAEFLVLGTLELAYPETKVAIDRALKLADRHYVKILVDVNWRPMFWPDPDVAFDRIHELLKRVDFLKLSESEAKWLFKTDDPGAIAHRMGNKEGVLVTRGDRGCSYCLSENEDSLPAFSVLVEDPTGAGDGFVSGFLHQLGQYEMSYLQDPDVAREIATYASAVGAIVASKPGAIAAQPTAEEVQQFRDRKP